MDDRDQDDKTERSRNKRRDDAIANGPLHHFRLPLFLKPIVKPLYEGYDALAQFIMCPSVKDFGPAV